MPLTVGDFRSLREDGLLYVDKTRQIASLLGPENKYVFLARPRRFGKTLLVSTLEALFRGEQRLFAGTWIADSEDSTWNWISHPVIRWDMTTLALENARSFTGSLRRRLQRLYRRQGLLAPDPDMSPGEMLSDLVEKMAVERGAVVLIDEYDAPVLRHIENQDELVRMRQVLRDFYGVLKVHAPDLRFVLLTGVTRFARTSVFSGLNNLRDVSPLPLCSDLVGFTEAELYRFLGPHVRHMAQALSLDERTLRQRMRHLYDGYLFAADGSRVYNPYSTLHCLQDHRLANYWAESGTPTFLTRMLVQQQVGLQDLIGQDAGRVATAVYNLAKPNLLVALYQTGYLTLDQGTPDRAPVTAFPNGEVEQTFYEALLEEYVPTPLAANSALTSLTQAIHGRDFDAFFRRFNDLLRCIPYEVQAGQEQYFQMLLHMVFVLMGYRTESERSTHRARLDTMVELEHEIVILEYKMDASAASALAQIADRGYHLPYLSLHKPIIGLGVCFDSRARQATDWQWQEMGTSAL